MLSLPSTEESGRPRAAQRPYYTLEDGLSPDRGPRKVVDPFTRKVYNRGEEPYCGLHTIEEQVKKMRENRQRRELEKRLSTDPEFAEDYRLGELFKKRFRSPEGRQKIEELASDCSGEAEVTNRPSDLYRRPSPLMTPPLRPSPMPMSPLLHACTPVDSPSASEASTPRLLGHPRASVTCCLPPPANSVKPHIKAPQQVTEIASTPLLPSPSHRPSMCQRIWEFIWSCREGVCRGCRTVWAWICSCWRSWMGGESRCEEVKGQ